MENPFQVPRRSPNPVPYVLCMSVGVCALAINEALVWTGQGQGWHLRAALKCLEEIRFVFLRVGHSLSCLTFHWQAKEFNNLTRYTLP